jgi:hypothetical protein
MLDADSIFTKCESSRVKPEDDKPLRLHLHLQIVQTVLRCRAARGDDMCHHAWQDRSKPAG